MEPETQPLAVRQGNAESGLAMHIYLFETEVHIYFLWCCDSLPITLSGQRRVKSVGHHCGSKVIIIRRSRSDG